MAVAPAAPAALGRHKGLVPRHVGHQPTGFVVINQGAPGHRDDAVGPRFSKAALGPARLARLGGKLPFIPEVHQRAGSVLGDEDHAAAAAAVAAVGAAGRHVFLPVEGNRSVPPVSRLDAYGRFIHEHGFSRLSAPIFSHFSAF